MNGPSVELENVTCHVILNDGSTKSFKMAFVPSPAHGLRYVQRFLAHNKLRRAASIRFTQDDPTPTQVDEALNQHDQSLEQTLRQAAEMLDKE